MRLAPVGASAQWALSPTKWILLILNDAFVYQHLDVPFQRVTAFAKGLRIMRTQMNLSGDMIVSLILRRAATNAEPDNHLASVRKSIKVMSRMALT
jgi:hypothetical protein